MAKADKNAEGWKRRRREHSVKTKLIGLGFDESWVSEVKIKDPGEFDERITLHNRTFEAMIDELEKWEKFRRMMLEIVS